MEDDNCKSCTRCGCKDGIHAGYCPRWTNGQSWKTLSAVSRGLDASRIINLTDDEDAQGFGLGGDAF